MAKLREMGAVGTSVSAQNKREGTTVMAGKFTPDKSAKGIERKKKATKLSAKRDKLG